MLFWTAQERLRQEKQSQRIARNNDFKISRAVAPQRMPVAPCLPQLDSVVVNAVETLDLHQQMQSMAEAAATAAEAAGTASSPLDLIEVKFDNSKLKPVATTKFMDAPLERHHKGRSHKSKMFINTSMNTELLEIGLNEPVVCRKP